MNETFHTHCAEDTIALGERLSAMLPAISHCPSPSCLTPLPKWISRTQRLPARTACICWQPAGHAGLPTEASPIARGCSRLLAKWASKTN